MNVCTVNQDENKSVWDAVDKACQRAASTRKGYFITRLSSLGRGSSVIRPPHLLLNLY